MSDLRWEVKIGSPVVASDGEFGHLQQLLMDPCRERLVALVVRQRGITPLHDYLVPEGKIVEATDHEVRLNLDREQLEALSNYWASAGLLVEGHNYQVDDEVVAVRGIEGFELYRSPNSKGTGWTERLPIDAGQKHLVFLSGAGHCVLCNGEFVGQATRVLFDPHGKIKSFVLADGQFSGLDLIVPAAWIREIDKENIHLSVDADDLEILQEYVPDNTLAENVLNALWNDEILQRTGFKEFSVVVRDGIVRLEGHAATPMNKIRAGRAAGLVSGVLGLVNNLVVDPDLVIEVAQALGENKLTKIEQISVGAQDGVITLTGAVRSQTVREAAETAAGGVPKVRGVRNLLKAPGMVVNPLDEQVRQPSIGIQVYASDKFLGQVEKVVINKRNRRVTAFVASGSFLAPGATGDDTSLVLPVYLERRFLVSMDQVRFEGDSLVQLNINLEEAARIPSYQPGNFMHPPEGWQPPYPYQPDEVLFMRE